MTDDVRERDECYERMQIAEKQVKAIAMLVSIYERQRENEPDEGWPEGDLHPSQVLLAIGETIGDMCLHRDSYLLPDGAQSRPLLSLVRGGVNDD